MKKAIIVGASSGIGRALAQVLSENGYVLGLAARREELLEELQKQLPQKSYVKRIDVTQVKSAQDQIYELILEMNGVELIIYSSGAGHINPNLDWKLEKETIDVNVTGFCSVATTSMRYFNEKGYGHFVAISSIAALRGNSPAPAYNSSKAFISSYMQGLRKRAIQSNKPIYVTDIKPGFVDTEMAKSEKLFWMAPVRKAAQQIYEAIEQKRKVAYITKRWRLIAWALELMPDFFYNKMK
jgi:short-subunit dehydrogenase